MSDLSLPSFSAYPPYTPPTPDPISLPEWEPQPESSWGEWQGPSREWDEDELPTADAWPGIATGAGLDEPEAGWNQWPEFDLGTETASPESAMELAEPLGRPLPMPVPVPTPTSTGIPTSPTVERPLASLPLPQPVPTPMATPTPATTPTLATPTEEQPRQATALPPGLDWRRVEQLGRMDQAAYDRGEMPGFERQERFSTHSWSGLKIEVFKPLDGGPVVVAVAGTDLWDPRDWGTNHAQATGRLPQVPRQYSEALELVQRVQAEFGNDVVVTGHSLGGAIATYVGMSTNSPVVTFNAAGLGDGTRRLLQAQGTTDSSRVVHIRTEDEFLTSEPLIPQEVLNLRYFGLPVYSRTPQLIGTVVTIPPDEPLPRIDSIGGMLWNSVPRLVGRIDDHRIGPMLAAISHQRQLESRASAPPSP